MSKLLNILFGFILVIPSGVCQEVVTTLPSATVRGERIREIPIGSDQVMIQMDSIQQLGLQNIGEWLAQETGVYVRQYGTGSLATSSIRGGSAGHTLVLWNGIPIQSPMLGQLDLSLLSIHAGDEVSVSPGGHSSLWGSGAIGGIVSLNANSDHYRPFAARVITQVGQFGLWQQSGSLTFKAQKFSGKTAFTHLQTDNDFDYFQAFRDE